MMLGDEVLGRAMSHGPVVPYSNLAKWNRSLVYILYSQKRAAS